MHCVEESRLGLGVTQLSRVARLAPGLEQRAVRRVLVHSGISIAIGDVNLVGGANTHVRRVMKRWATIGDAVFHWDAASGHEWPCRLALLLGVAGIGGLVARAEREPMATFLAELEHDLGLAVHEVHRVVWRDAHAVRVFEDLLAPVV